MSPDTSNTRWGTAAPNRRLGRLLAPILAAVYPLALMGFHASAVAAGSGGGAAWLGASAFLLLAFLGPPMALLAAVRLASIQAPSVADLRARRIAILAVAAPPIYTFAGVILYMAGIPDADTWILAVFWGALAIVAARGDGRTPIAAEPSAPKAGFRVAHGAVALAIVLVFLAGHIANHFFGLAGPDAHTAVRKALQHIYRAPLVEPALLAGLLFQVVSGAYLAWRLSAKATDGLRTFQIASGVYLMFFLLSHVNAVFVFARSYLKIDPGWAFATGAPTGLILDPWNIRLVPLYGLAIFFVLSHLAAGARVAMLAHGAKKESADAVQIRGAALAALAAALILLGMCGLRLHFE